IRGAPANAGDFTEQYTFSGNALAGPHAPFADGRVPSQLAMLLSGHIHMFQYVNFDDAERFAPQMIVGVGGTLLDPDIEGSTPTYAAQNVQFTIHNSTATSGLPTQTVNHEYAQAEFGFALLQAQDNGYQAWIYNADTTRAGTCTITLTRRNIVCWQ
ncbi:MAG: hypothetical protein JO326_00930, partial [Acetobacteraceae bacterium]|nr:hypothetical protein [Acetobacteraceae bacterium]